MHEMNSRIQITVVQDGETVWKKYKVSVFTTNKDQGKKAYWYEEINRCQKGKQDL